VRFKFSRALIGPDRDRSTRSVLKSADGLRNTLADLTPIAFVSLLMHSFGARMKADGVGSIERG